jgi:hypothetical protein
MVEVRHSSHLSSGVHHALYPFHWAGRAIFRSSGQAVKGFKPREFLKSKQNINLLVQILIKSTLIY